MLLANESLHVGFRGLEEKSKNKTRSAMLSHVSVLLESGVAQTASSRMTSKASSHARHLDNALQSKPERQVQVQENNLACSFASIFCRIAGTLNAKNNHYSTNLNTDIAAIK